MNSTGLSGLLPSVAALSAVSQNKCEMPPSTQEIRDKRKEQQTKSAEKIKLTSASVVNVELRWSPPWDWKELLKIDKHGNISHYRSMKLKQL